MGIPDLPTDNLYKFMATFGFLIAVLSFGYLAVSYANISEAISKEEVTSRALASIIDAQRSTFDRQVDNLALEADFARSETDRLMALVLDSPELFEQKDLDALVLETARLQGRLNESLKEFERLSIDLQERGLPFRQELAALRARYENWKSLVWFLLGAGIAGLLTSFSGFKLWYDRVQIHQDAILAQQAAGRGA